jgi:hypothetical protein
MPNSHFALRSRLSTLKAVLALVSLALPCAAADTQSWIQNEWSDFEKGTLKRLSLRSDGRLSLGPVFEQLYDSATPYLWAITGDAKGNIYAGGGGPGTTTAPIIVIDPNRKSRVLAELPGLQIQALAVDRGGTLFAATTPDGKVYRINGSKPELFYDPKAKYIWAMAFNSKGDLFVATGDAGEVHRVQPNGTGSVFFRTEETHARSLAIDPKDNLILGTEPSGLVIRVSPAGEGFVVYQSSKREVTSVAVGKDGLVYAAAVGNRSTNRTSDPSQLSIPPLPVPAAPANRTGGGTSTTIAVVPSQPPAGQTPATPTSIPGGSELYRIESDGFPRKLWTNSQEIVYAIAFDDKGLPLLATGNRGKIFRVDNENLWTLLVDAEAAQITSFYTAPNGRLFATTGNIGKVFRLGPELEKSGVYESESYDSGFFSFWGRAAVKGNAQIETRSGNLERTQASWSPWAALNQERVASPAARFLQYRATLSGSDTVSQVEIAYLAKNIAPSVDLIEITPPNYKFPAPSGGLGLSTTLSLPPLGQRKRTPSTSIETTTTPAMTYSRYAIGARWTASDPNGDDLEYSVSIRGEKESQWKLLKQNLRERYFSWDSSAFADGAYFVKIEVTDAPGNPPEQASTTSKESDRFLIDNTPPQITGLTGTRNGSVLKATWQAKDALSNLTRAEYTLNGSDWKMVQPTTRLFDGPSHEFDLTIANFPAGEQTLAVRVTDEFENQSVQSITVK